MDSFERQRSGGVVPFNFEGGAVRVVMRGDDPWFVLVDVCRALGNMNPSQVSTRLDSDEKDTLTIVEGGNINGLGSVGAMPVVVNQSGLYALILKSRKPEARRFRKWVTAVVLPSIHKSGGYRHEPAPMIDLNNSALILKALEAQARLALAETQRADKAEERVNVLLPQAHALRLIAAEDDRLSLTQAAKNLEVPPAKFIAWLMAHGWIYRGAHDSHWTPYQDKINAGYMTVKFIPVLTKKGVQQKTQALFTAKGIAKVAYLRSQMQLRGLGYDGATEVS